MTSLECLGIVIFLSLCSLQLSSFTLSTIHLLQNDNKDLMVPDEYPLEVVEEEYPLELEEDSEDLFPLEKEEYPVELYEVEEEEDPDEPWQDGEKSLPRSTNFFLLLLSSYEKAISNRPYPTGGMGRLGCMLGCSQRQSTSPCCSIPLGDTLFVVS